MGEPFNYNRFAKTYSETRDAKDWITNPLVEEISKYPEGSAVLEVGCGTGNYIIAVSNKLLNYFYYGFDLSEEMLKVAKSRSVKIDFRIGNADKEFPYRDNFADIAFLVDVIHHITDYPAFFRECFRILKQSGTLLIITDSEENIRKRSGVKYFPEQLDIELKRYPKIDELLDYGKDSGLDFTGSSPAEGYMEINDELTAKLERRYTSSLQLISDIAHRRGMKRVDEAKLKREKWFSNYTVLKYKKLK